jgi:hypothetical protein
MKITKSNFLIKFCLLSVFVFALFSAVMPGTVSANSLWDKQVGMGTQDGVGEAFGEDPGVDRNNVRDIRLVIANAIRVFLGFMGVVFLILIIYAGILWMTAAGKEDQVGKAKSLLIAATIGLIIVVASFAIAELITIKIFESVTDTLLARGEVAG